MLSTKGWYVQGIRLDMLPILASMFACIELTHACGLSGRRMGLPMPSDMAASSGAAHPVAPFMAPPTAAGSSGAAHQSAAMPDMPSDINVEEARYTSLLPYSAQFSRGIRIDLRVPDQ